MQTPTQILTPFANEGQKNNLPQTGTSEDVNASWQMGFPPRTMSTGADKVGPSGRDMNGVLNAHSEAVRFAQAGGLYPFSSQFATAIGGYPRGALVLGSDGTTIWENLTANNMASPSTANGWRPLGNLATAQTAGLVRVDGTTITVDANGIITAALPPIATTATAGIVRPDGTTITVTSAGVISSQSAGVPVGTIIWHGGDGSDTAIPSGYLLCNGAAYSRTTYSALYTAIGYRYGGSASSPQLPNLIDKFAQGSATAGTVKSAGLPNITGYFGVDMCATLVGGAIHWNGEGTGGATGSGSGGRRVDLNASWSSSIYGNSTTVQPPALTLLPLIKY